MNKIKLTCVVLLAAVLMPLAAAEADSQLSDFAKSLVNNQYLQENLRLIDLAEKSYAAGQFDESYKYAEEAIKYAQLSDDWVKSQTLDKEQSAAAFASQTGSVTQTTAAAANTTESSADAGVLPSQYIVKTWVRTKDCLWNIAARPQVYGDPFKWKVIYNANKDKLPHPENPDLIEPGTVLDIPSIKGETRSGVLE